MRIGQLLCSLLLFVGAASTALARNAWPQPAQVAQQPPSIYERLSHDTAQAGPAPKHDISGVWAGPIGSKINPPPPMTPLGQARFSANKPEGKFMVAGSNDPWKTCDPLGFPRNILVETRGITFAPMHDRLEMLIQYNRVWREIFTDGRELPKNVGGRAKGSPDPRWFGYSVGHWDGDYTFVINSTGSDDRSWLDNEGHPHSVDMRVEERYTRVDHNTLVMTVTIDDPKIYTQPFEIAKTTFKWIPNQEFEEQICVPSEELEYLKAVADPAGQP